MVAVLYYTSRRPKYHRFPRISINAVSQSSVPWRKVLLQEKRRLPLKIVKKKTYLFPGTPVVITPEQFGGGRTLFLYYTSRRLRVPRPHKALPSFTPLPPSNLSWKKPLIRFRRRLPLTRLFRPKHIIFTPAKPSGFIPWQKSLHRFISRRPMKRFFRHKNLYTIFIQIPPAGFIARPNKLTKVRRKRFFPFRHKVYLFPGAPTPPPDIVVSSGRQIWEEELDDLTFKLHRYHQKLIDQSKFKTGEEIRAIAQKLGKLGGEARAKSMTSTQKSNQASKAAQVRWKK